MKKQNDTRDGFNIYDTDTNIRQQDDFYHYTNGKWLKNNPIPLHESRWGSFLMLHYDTEKKLHTLITDIQDKKNLKVGSSGQMVRDFYISALDMKRRNELGMKPIAPFLNLIKKIKDVQSLVLTFARLERTGGGGPFGIEVDQDMKNSEKYILYIYQSGLGMPDRDYYLKNDVESLRVRNAYEKHIEAILILSGRTKNEAKNDRETIMRMETNIAKASMTKEDLRDVDKTYHKMSVSSLSRTAPAVNWNLFLKEVGAEGVRNIVVMQPKFITAISKMLKKESVEDWKTYLTWHLIDSAANSLTAKLEKQNFAFYGTVLSGVTKMKPVWRRALGSVNDNLDGLLGELYVKNYFSQQAKKKIKEVVDDLFEAYEARIKNLDWMSTPTKRKAVKKLHQINRKLGYPDKWKSYRGLTISPHDYFGNLIHSALFENKRKMRRLHKPVDRSEWFMRAQTVNAYYSFGMNDIVFPAAILQSPFFSVDADDAINYGAIGSVIGHEITHGFDDQGSKFNGKGNRKTWWARSDSEQFTKKAKVLIKQFNEYTVADGIKVNGQLTLGENIADLGGASIAFDAYQIRLKKTARKDIDGFTPEQRFFLGFALVERENERSEAQKTHVLTDPHSPSIFRINGPASNLPEFYEAFSVKKGDRLYRTPKSRAKIW